MQKNYDVLLLLTGEDEVTRPRSNRALEIVKQGRVGHVFISGGYGGFNSREVRDGNPECDRIADWLRERVPDPDMVLQDRRPLDTLGNFAFPFYEPLKGNPELDPSQCLLVTEGGHMERTLAMARVSVPGGKMDYEASPGSYSPGLTVKLYERGIRRATSNIDGNPAAAMEFLYRCHPFYQLGWFDKDVGFRQFIMAMTAASWNVTEPFVPNFSEETRR